MVAAPNRVIKGNSQEKLKKIPSEHVNLIYLDPPFFAKRVFGTEEKSGKKITFDDTWNNDIHTYLDFMKKIFTESKRVLKDTGSIYVHCDWHASHYLKVMLDKIFGYENFRNEIIWKRHNCHSDGKQGSKHYGRVHDSILFYSKSKNYPWNLQPQPYPEEYVKKNYRHVEAETGRRYALTDLTGPGGASKGNARYEFLGITRYWRNSKKRMEELYKEGVIIQTKPGNVPVRKRYLDEMKGIPIQDVWDDIKSAQVRKNESWNYPTQKPLELLVRIIETSSNEKDIVLDPMCGSGTALEAAKRLNRRYIGIDNSEDAVRITRKRLQKLNHKKTKTEKPISIRV